VDFGVTISLVQLLIETLHGVDVKRRGLAQQVHARFIDYDDFAVGLFAARESTEHKLGIQPVMAFFEITSIRHLRNDVGGAEDFTDAAHHRIIHADGQGITFITGEMDDHRRVACVFFQTDGRHVFKQELRAA